MLRIFLRPFAREDNSHIFTHDFGSCGNMCSLLALCFCAVSNLSRGTAVETLPRFPGHDFRRVPVSQRFFASTGAISAKSKHSSHRYDGEEIQVHAVADPCQEGD